MSAVFIRFRLLIRRGLRQIFDKVFATFLYLVLFCLVPNWHNNFQQRPKRLPLVFETIHFVFSLISNCCIIVYPYLILCVQLDKLS